MRAILVPRGWIWACDSSLELSRRKNDQGMNLFWFARAAQPQRTKMCSAHYIKMEMRGPIWPCDTSLEPSCYKNDHVMGEIRFARAARPQRAKMCSAYYISHLKMMV